MQHLFGELVTARRAELRLTLRDCAIRSGMTPGNLSKIERGRLAPPQQAGVLSRLIEALELKGANERQRLLDVATAQKGRIPAHIVQQADLAASMPSLLPTLSFRQLNETAVARFLEMIRCA